ncbi:unnamed protein product, partial [Allacma fusca]
MKNTFETNSDDTQWSPSNFATLEENQSDLDSNNFLSSDENDSDFADKLEDPIDFLRQWAVCHKIQSTALTELQTYLKSFPNFKLLPSDSRTLLKTPRSTEVKLMQPDRMFILALNQMCYEHSQVSRAPQNVENVLEDFLVELKEIQENGIEYEGEIYIAKIDCFVCDAPARSYILSIKCHNGYKRCSKCCITGEYRDNREVFIQTGCRRRTDESFRSHEDNEHHIGKSPLTQLQIDMINRVPLEYMHLICLGSVKKLLKLWIKSKPAPFKISSNQ